MSFFYFLSFPKKWNMLYCYRSVKYYGMRENMSEEKFQFSVARQKRVQRLKKLIICILPGSAIEPKGGGVNGAGARDGAVIQRTAGAV